MKLNKIRTSSAAGIEISVSYLGWIKLVSVQINVNTSTLPLSIGINTTNINCILKKKK